jgi:hypothetical protein
MNLLLQLRANGIVNGALSRCGRRRSGWFTCERQAGQEPEGRSPKERSDGPAWGRRLRGHVHRGPFYGAPSRIATHPGLFRRPLSASTAAAKLDAWLAALAIERGATLCSTDADFSRFPALKWLNPLAD